MMAAMESLLISRYMEHISIVRRYSARTRIIYGQCLADFCAFVQAGSDDVPRVIADSQHDTRL